MATPLEEIAQPLFSPNNPTLRSSEDHTHVGDGSVQDEYKQFLNLDTSDDTQEFFQPQSSPSQTREQEHRLEDDLALLQAERVVSDAQRPLNSRMEHSMSVHRSRSRRSDVDDFDVNTNPIHEKTAMFRPPEHPTTNIAKAFKRIHNSSFLVRYITYITPVVIILLIPLLLGALVFKKASVGGVSLLWFSVWLEIVWLTLWAGRVSLQIYRMSLKLLINSEDCC